MALNNLHSVAFPVLDDAQIAQLVNCTHVVAKPFKDGETLIAIGERNVKFFIVKSGEIEILDKSGDEPRTIAIHRKGNRMAIGVLSRIFGETSSVSTSISG